MPHTYQQQMHAAEQEDTFFLEAAKDGDPSKLNGTVRLGSTKYLTFRRFSRTQKIKKSKIHSCYSIKRT